MCPLEADQQVKAPGNHVPDAPYNTSYNLTVT